MSDIVGVVGMSHNPFWDSREPIDPATPNRFFAGVRQAQLRAGALRPTTIVVIGPDHFRNVFYDLMPPFCIGGDRVTSFGDWQTPAGEVPAAALARPVHAGVTGAGFDPALSLHLGVDHGIMQSYLAFAPNLDIALLPIIVSCSGPAMPTVERCRDFGYALGAALRAYGTERVLVIGSGGLSHWLPSTDPDAASVDHEWREFLVDGRPRAREIARDREDRILAIADTLQGRINEEWDRGFLDQLQRGAIDVLARLDTESIEAAAGNGGQEIRTWMVAAAASHTPLDPLGYEPMPQWLTGMAVAAAF